MASVVRASLRLMRSVTMHYPFLRGRSRIGSRLSRFQPPRDGTTVMIDDDLEIELRSNDTVSEQLYWFGEFEAAETSFLARTLRPGMCVLDVGAHLGAHTLVMAKRVGPRGRVFAFEPEQSNHALLERNVDRNGFAERVAISRSAVADVQREGDLVEEGGSGNWLAPAGAAPRTAQSIRCTTVDVVAQEARIRRVDLIKTDTEGAEPLVLKGAEGVLDEFRPILLVEFAARFLARYESTPEDLLQLLRRNRYSPYRLGRKTIHPLDQRDDISNTNLVFLPAEQA